MAMVINTNTQATYTHGIYNKNNSYMNDAMTRVATGQKINSAKDNASVWAISQRMRDRIRANDQANQNVQNDSALIRTAQGGISNTVSILTTLKERAINSANDSNLNLDRDAIAAEVQQLTQQIDENATKVKFNGRYLLNGASDGTAAAEETAADSTDKVSTITEPTAASMPSNTYGNHALFKLELNTLRIDNGSGKVSNTASGTTLLTALLNDNSLSNNTDVAAVNKNGIKVGDTITFSWKEDGQEQSYSYEVKANSAISDLTFDVSKLQLAYPNNTTALTTNETGTYDDNGTSRNNNAVLNSSNSPINAASSTLYAIGDKGVEITDFKISVTYNDYFNDNKATTRSADDGEINVQDILKFTGVQQRNPEAEVATGSASVVKFTNLQEGSAIATEDTQLINLKIGGNLAITSGAWDDEVTLKWGDGDDEQITVQGRTTLGELNEQLALQNKGVTLNIVGNTAQNIKDADGNYVTQDADGLNYQAAASGAATQADIYLVGKTGATIDASKVSLSAVDSDGNARTIDSAFKGTAVLGIAAEEETTTEETTTEPLTIAPSTPLSFHVGGEQDFAIDVTIDKMTVDNLFAQKDDDGNITKIYDDSTFSELFKTKEAIGIIDTALNKALAEQTKLGAVETRLGYTSDNLTTMNENLEAANSAFRDSDIAKEMTNYMKYSVLAQASQYMLAQASQNAFSVLNLLQA